MRQLIIVLLLGLLAFPGCGNLSPQNKGSLRNRINNQGQIDDIRSDMQELQGSVNAELGNVRNENRITADKLENFQEGVIAYRHQNTGFQFIQGDGALIFVLALCLLGVGALFIVLYYRDKAAKNEKAVEILAEQVANFNDPNLEDKVFAAALHSDAKKEVLYAIKRYQKR